MKKDLIEAYDEYKDSLVDDTYVQLKAKKDFEDTFSKYTQEELKDEIVDLEIYAHFLKKQIFYTFDYKEPEDYENLAFTPQEIYRLYLEKDLAIYSVLSECTDDYLRDVVRFFVANDYDDEAIMMIANYMNQKQRFSK